MNDDDFEDLEDDNKLLPDFDPEFYRTESVTIQAKIANYVKWANSYDQDQYEKIRKLFPVNEWKKVVGKKRKNSEETTTAIETSNLFENLPDENDLKEQTSMKINLKRAEKPKPTKKPSKETVTQKKEKPMNHFPPIITRGMDTWVFQKHAKDNNIEVCIKSSRGRQTITATKKEDYEALKQMIRDGNTGGHTYPTQEERRSAVVLKGLPHECDPLEIQSEIEQRTSYKVEVRHMKTDASREGGYKVNLFVVSGESPQMKEVTSLSNIMYHRVHWEKLIKDDVSRCRRCQRYGHSARFCLHDPRCARCKENHDTTECKTEEVTKEKAFCVNCGTFGHPASYRGCAVRKQVIKTMMTRKNEKKKREEEVIAKRDFGRTSVARTISPGISFADALNQGQSRAPQKHVSQPNSMDFITSEVPKLFTCGAGELMEKIHNFLPQYRSALNLGEKQTMFLNLMFAICRTD